MTEACFTELKETEEKVTLGLGNGRPLKTFSGCLQLKAIREGITDMEMMLPDGCALKKVLYVCTCVAIQPGERAQSCRSWQNCQVLQLME